jgi:glycosyltransferase involved in cell wall biosynthesis
MNSILIKELPSVDVIIPAKNEAENLIKLIPLLREQSYSINKIIIIDNQSNDNTISVAKASGCHIVSVPEKEFDHGISRNHAVKKSKSKFIFMTVADAIPSSNDLIYILAQKLINNTQAAAVVGVQGAPSLPTIFPRNWLISRQKNYPQTISSLKKDIGPVADNCVTLYRSKYLKMIPFESSKFGEDLIWSNRTKTKGLRIILEKKAGVLHYHKNTFSYYRKRSRLFQHILYKEYGLDYGSNLINRSYGIIGFLNEYYHSVLTCNLGVWIKWLPYAIKLAHMRSKGFQDYFKNKNYNEFNLHRRIN